MSVSQAAQAVQTAQDTWFGLNEVQAVFITAAFAAAIAIWGIFSQRGISARQTTIQYLRDAERDTAYVLTVKVPAKRKRG